MNLTPVFYTMKAYYIRVYCREYKTWDLGVDSLIFEQLCYTLMYIAYVLMKGFSLYELAIGQVVSILFLIGKQSITIAYGEGPGGPVNAILLTQSIYQVLLDYFVDHQEIGMYGLLGFLLALVGTLVIALGNMIVKKCIKREKYD